MSIHFPDNLHNARPANPDADRSEYFLAMEQLIEVVQKLSLAQNLEQIIDITCHAARALTGADGATFVLREGESSHYINEEAIGPLWKGQKFPLDSCIGGWCIRQGQTVVIPDVFADDRIPSAAYAPTFVKSLVMVPIRTLDPLGAIGNYWANGHIATAQEIKLLESLANATSIAIEKIQINTDLQRQVSERQATEVILQQQIQRQVGMPFANHLMFWTWASSAVLPLMMPLRCPSSWRMVVRRSYLPAVAPVVAR